MVPIEILQDLKKTADDQNVEPRISIFQSLGNRYVQEDRYVVAQIYNGHLLAIMDGYGGARAANYVASNLPAYFRCEYQGIWNKVQARISKDQRVMSKVVGRTIKSLYTELMKEESGTTLSLIYVRPIGRNGQGKRRLWLTAATLGDSPLIIWTGKENIIMPIH